jgi:hypothetical protein
VPALPLARDGREWVEVEELRRLRCCRPLLIFETHSSGEYASKGKGPLARGTEVGSNTAEEEKRVVSTAGGRIGSTERSAECKGYCKRAYCSSCCCGRGGDRSRGGGGEGLARSGGEEWELDEGLSALLQVQRVAPGALQQSSE